MKYTFEQLPEAISTLHEKVDSIKDLLVEMYISGNVTSSFRAKLASSLSAERG